eukprot:1161596-Pelagomonas_calceolata.AAC.13
MLAKVLVGPALRKLMQAVQTVWPSTTCRRSQEATMGFDLQPGGLAAWPAVLCQPHTKHARLWK